MAKLTRLFSSSGRARLDPPGGARAGRPDRGRASDGGRHRVDLAQVRAVPLHLQEARDGHGGRGGRVVSTIF